MGQIRALLSRVRVEAASTGVSTAYSASRMPETLMRAMSGVFVDFRGTIRKLPKRVNQSGLLLEPTKIKVSGGEYVSLFTSMDKVNCTKITSVGSSVESFINSRDLLTATVSKSVPASYDVWERAVVTGDGEVKNPGTGGASNQVYCSFQFRSSKLPLDVPSGNNGSVQIMMATQADNPYSIALCAGGIYVAISGSEWALAHDWSDATPTDGKAHTVEAWVDADLGTFSAAFDGDKTVTAVTAHTTGYTTAGYLRTTFFAGSSMADTEVFTISMWNFILRDDTDDPVRSAKIRSTLSRDKTPVRRHHNFLATNQYVWHEINHSGIWKPLLRLAKKDCFMFSFKERVLVIDKAASGPTTMYEIKENLEVEELADAPNVRIGATHDSRVWALGDVWPHRLYFSAPNNPKVWFSPETDADGQEDFEEVTSAGYLTLQAKPGEEPVAIVPNFYGIMLVVTNKGTYKVQQVSAPTAYSSGYGLFPLTDSFEAYSPYSVCRVGNDVWAAGPEGISSLQSTDKFGDLQSHKLSSPIQDIFADVGSGVRDINEARRDSVSLTYHSASGLVYFCYAGLGSIEPNTLWIYNTGTESWYGPHSLDIYSMGLLRVGSSKQDSIVVGAAGGTLEQFTSYEHHSDSISMQTASFDGRTISPLLAPMEKTWKFVRLYYNPRSTAEYTLSWRTTGKWHSKTVRLTNALDPIEEKFRVGYSALGSSEEMAVLEVELDVRGKSLDVKLSSSTAKTISLHTIEAEFSHDGYERG